MGKVIINNLSFSYLSDDELVIEELNLKINEGDFVCVLGQSGCGKSTLLRILAGLEKPTKGTVRVDGKEVEGASLSRSVVFQDYSLFPWLSVGDNILIPLKNRFPKKKKHELVKIAKKMLCEVGLSEDVYNKFPKALSGGMKQRCAIASSLSLDPPILLMDEPFGALDAVTRARLQDMILRLWKKDEKKKTVFFVTHDVEEALLLATRIVVLGQKPSHIIYECSIPEELKGTRDTLFENEKMISLRSELIRHINHDVESRIKQD